MRTMRYILSFGAILSCMILFFSCAEEEIVKKDTSADGKTVKITINTPANKIVSPMTKAQKSESEKIENLNILIYAAEDGEQGYTGDLILSESHYYSQGGDNSGLESLTDNSAATYYLNCKPGLKKVYVIANAGNLLDTDGNGSLSEKIVSVTALGKARFGLDNGGISPQKIMFAEGNDGNTFNTVNNSSIPATLVRIYSMVTVVMNTEGVTKAKITPNTLKLYNVPMTGRLLGENLIEKKEESMHEAEILSTASEQAGKKWTPTTHGENASVLYLYENKQPDGYCSNNDQTTKTPQSVGGVSTSTDVLNNDFKCSYIEVEADYLRNGSAVGGSGSGKVKYRFFLGLDELKNFEILRNTHYKITLTLIGDGGVDEATWRVEPDIMEDFTVEDAYVGYRQGETSKIVIKLPKGGETFFEGCTWDITVKGTNKNIIHTDASGVTVNNTAIDVTALATNIQEREERFQEYFVTAKKEGKIIATKPVTVHQVIRILDPIAYYKKAINTETERIEVKQFNKALPGTSIGAYEVLKSIGPWTAEIESYGPSDGEWFRINKVLDNTNTTEAIANKKITGIGGDIVFNYTPNTAAGNNVRYGCILVSYHNNMCKHRIFLRMGDYVGKGTDIQILNGGVSWACTNVSDPVNQNNEYPTQVSPIFQGGQNSPKNSFSPGYGDSYAGWINSVSWGNNNWNEKQGPCPVGYKLPSVDDFTAIRQACGDNGKLSAYVGYVHDDSPQSGWGGLDDGNIWTDGTNYCNPAKGLLLVNRNMSDVNIFFTYGKGRLVHSKKSSDGHTDAGQSYDNGLDEIGVGSRTSSRGYLHFHDDYLDPSSGSSRKDVISYGARYWSGTPSRTGASSHMLYANFWYFLNRNNPVYVSDGSGRDNSEGPAIANGAVGVTMAEGMFVRCVRDNSGGSDTEEPEKPTVETKILAKFYVKKRWPSSGYEPFTGEIKIIISNDIQTVNVKDGAAVGDYDWLGNYSSSDKIYIQGSYSFESSYSMENLLKENEIRLKKTY